ncbi:phage portal protein [Crossiella sp. NPDC003009]
MSFLDRFFGRGQPEQRGISLDSFTPELQRFLLENYDTKTGLRINAATAMRLSAVYGCVNIISSTISTLPIETFRRGKDGTRTAQSLPKWIEEPRGPQGSMNQIRFIGQLIVSLLLNGNAYFVVERNGYGRILAAVVLDPRKVALSDEDGRITYHVNGRRLTPNQDLVHIVGIEMPGEHLGVSPIKAASQSIAVTLSAQEYGAKFFGNSAMPTAVIETEGRMSDEAANRLTQRWKQLHGRDAQGGLAVLTEGAAFKRISLSPDEAQFLETRKYGVADVARLFSVPVHLLADASQSTSWGSGLAEQNAMFAQHTLRPWVTRVEHALTRLVRTEPDTPLDTYIRINMDELLRGSLEERFQSHIWSIQYGIKTMDEIRAEEDLPPHPRGIGTAPYIPLNMGPVGPNTERAEGQAAEQEHKAEIARLTAEKLAIEIQQATHPDPDPEYPGGGAPGHGEGLGDPPDDAPPPGPPAVAEQKPAVPQGKKDTT